jgi:hypothetical protein
MPEGTIACPTLELAVLSSEQSRRGLFGAQQIAAPPSIGDFYDAATSTLMVASEDNTVASVEGQNSGWKDLRASTVVLYIETHSRTN